MSGRREPDRGYGRLIGGYIRSSTQMRLSSVCITETGGSECRVNSDVSFFCFLSQSAGWWNRSPMAVFLPCKAAALPAVVDPREGASPLVPAAQVRLFRPDCCLIIPSCLYMWLTSIPVAVNCRLCVVGWHSCVQEWLMKSKLGACQFIHCSLRIQSCKFQTWMSVVSL